MELKEKLVNELFENKVFQAKLNEYIIKNLKIRKDFNSYTGEYDEVEVSFAEQTINIDSKTYGY